MGVMNSPGFEPNQPFSPQHQPLSEEATHSAAADPGRNTTHRSLYRLGRYCARVTASLCACQPTVAATSRQKFSLIYALNITSRVSK